MDMFYAHTDPNRPELLPDEDGGHWQLLKDHLLNTARLARALAVKAKPDDDQFAAAAYFAGLFHDLGKYRPPFQRMLFDAVEGRPLQKVQHAKYGAAYAFAFSAFDVSLAVLGHHAGLSAGVDLRPKMEASLEKEARLLVENEMIGLDGMKDHLCSELRRPEFLNGDHLGLELWIRMLTGCLVDADRLDCFAHKNGYVPECRRLKAQLWLDKILKYIEGRAAAARNPEMVEIRNRILDACLKSARNEKRLFSLTVPTGGGKTLSSMAFALKRAVLRPEEVRRIFVVIPFLSIIEQNAAVYEEVLGKENIVQHHSGDFIKPMTKGWDGDREDLDGQGSRVFHELAAENWDAPIVVTTSVRFFESLFSNRPSDLRRLHNIARSVVILDEVQTLPSGFLEPLLSMMEGLAKDWDVTFVFCTATQPAFEKPAEALAEDRRWPEGTIAPIIPDNESRYLFRELQRVVQPKWPGPKEKVSWEDLAEKLADEPRVLCVVNVKNHALQLYQVVQSRLAGRGESGEGLFHLSTRMCPLHRLERIAEIKRILDEGGICRVISTQLVEAGVDLDFPVVFRAMGPFDSIIQAAGRCDREGRLTRAAGGRPAGRMIIFIPEDRANPYRRETHITHTLSFSMDLSLYDPERIREYFNLVFEKDLDAADIQGLRRRLDFPEVAVRFRMIDDHNMRAVLVSFNQEASDLIGRLREDRDPDPKLRRRLQPYHVGLYPNEFEQARSLGAIVELWPGSDLWVSQLTCYSPEVGLVLASPTPESFIV